MDGGEADFPGVVAAGVAVVFSVGPAAAVEAAPRFLGVLIGLGVFEVPAEPSTAGVAACGSVVALNDLAGGGRARAVAVLAALTAAAIVFASSAEKAPV